MKRRLLMMLALGSVLTACVESPEDLGGNVAPDSGAQSVERPVVVYPASMATPGVVIVKFGESDTRQIETNLVAATASQKPVTGLESMDEWMNSVGAVHMERLFPYNAKFDKRAREAGLHLWYVVHFDENIPMGQIESGLVGVEGVKVIEYVVPVKAPEYTVSEATEVVPTAINYPFNDPRISEQWHYENDGSKSSIKAQAGADINLLAAWGKCTGSKNITVAIIDGGIKYTHQDIAANMWVNTVERDGTPGVDDDGNGYVDDIYGFNFCVNASGQMIGAIEFDDHGTHVGGTVSAVNNNGIGVAGIAGGSGQGDGVRLMSCQILDSYGNGSYTQRAFQYAADNGAIVAQNSWGYQWPGGVMSASAWRSSSLKSAIDYFRNHAGTDKNGNQVGPMKGGLAVWAAGNDGDKYSSPTDIYPGADPDVLTVGSMGPDYLPAYYTNWGDWVNVTAPGGDQIFNTYSGGIMSTTIDGSSDVYEYFQGTSMACPHVSGIAALALSYADQLGMSVTPQQLREMIESTAHNFDDKMVGTKYDPYNMMRSVNLAEYRGLLGTGYVDAAAVLAQLDGMSLPDDHQKPAPIASATQTDATPEQVTVAWKVTADYKGNPVSSYKVEYSTSPIVGNRVGVSTQAEATTITVQVGDKAVGDDISATITGLHPNSVYYVAISAVDQWNASSDPLQIEASTVYVLPPSPVSGLEATPDRTKITLKWTAQEDAMDTPCTYDLYWSTQEEGLISPANKSTVQGKPAGETITVVKQNLTPSTTYYYAVVTIDKWGVRSYEVGGSSTTLEATAPVPVTGMAVSDVTYTGMKVAWKAGVDCVGAQNREYILKWDTKADFSTARSTTVAGKPSGQTVSHTITGLTHNTQYYLAVIAVDQFGLQSTPATKQQQTEENVAPELTADAGTDLTVQYWSNGSLSFTAKDPKGDKVTYNLTDNAGLLVPVQEGDKITLSLAGRNDKAGSYSATLQLSDELGMTSQTLTINYTIVGNAAPVAGSALGNVFFTGLNAASSISLAGAFTDANNETLTYSVQASQGVTASISGETLSVTATRYGGGTVTVTATDHAGAQATQTFQTMARNNAVAVELYPNPVVDVMNVRMGQQVSGTINLRLLSSTGSKVFEGSAQIAPFAPAKVDLRSVAAGSYVVEVEYNGEVYRNNIVKK